MKNIWLTRHGRKRTIHELNRLLNKFIGHAVTPLEDLVAKMRTKVMEYFKINPDDLKLFVENGSLDYQFNISHNNNRVIAVEFEPL